MKGHWIVQSRRLVTKFSFIYPMLQWHTIDTILYDYSLVTGYFFAYRCQCCLKLDNIVSCTKITTTRMKLIQNITDFSCQFRKILYVSKLQNNKLVVNTLYDLLHLYIFLVSHMSSQLDEPKLIDLSGSIYIHDCI